MQNLTAATATLNPRVVLQMLGAYDEESPGAGGGATSADIRGGIAAGFDDFKVAQLLATTLAIDGQASERLARVFDTIATDEPRKRRVLTMTRTLLSETSFGHTNQFQTLWTSMEELLLTYNEKPFVSARTSWGSTRSARAPTRWRPTFRRSSSALIETLGQDNVRRLSVALLIDLLTLEKDPERAPELARDVAALGEDLLLAGDYESALIVTRALAGQARTPGAVASAGQPGRARRPGQTAAFDETVDLLGEMTPEDAEGFRDICTAVGPAAVDALRQLLEVDELTAGRQRASAIIRALRRAGRHPARAARGQRSVVYPPQRRGAARRARGAGKRPVPAAAAARGRSARHAAAVRALSNINDPAAARAVHTVLRAATGAQRRAVVDALVAQRDPRVVPVLVRILDESEPFGSDHPIVLETLGALGEVGDDEVVPALAKVMRRRSWFARRKTRVLKTGLARRPARIGSPAATQRDRGRGEPRRSPAAQAGARGGRHGAGRP